MLTQLTIKNFAIVQSLTVEFNAGLSVITGETGTGKSITVDALGLVLGDRADNQVIRDGTDRAEISASFDISANSQTAQWLTEQGLDDQECILRRVLSRDGRSRAFINGTPVTLAQLRDMGESLIDIHSQHEHQSLLNRATHRRLLDDFAGTNELVNEVQDLYKAWSETQVQLNIMREQLQSQTDQRQLLKYQLEELAELDLQENELEQLEQEQSRLANAEQILSSGQQVMALCSASEIDNSAGCNELISQAIKFSEDIQDEHAQLQECRDLLHNARIQVEEAIASLNHYLDSVEVNPQRLRDIEERLSSIYQLARKHHIQPVELPEFCLKLSQEFEQLDGIDDQIDELEQQLNESMNRYQALSATLSQKRQKASQRFDKSIAEHLHELGMGGCQFVTQLSPIATSDSSTPPSAHGNEDIEFLVSANPGQAPRQLSKVASGGELSRISLAIQVMSAQASDMPVMVFDEVDVGIGGATAEVVGQMLRQLGESGQVICVTHQPQVAAKAHNHLSVSKHSNDGQTDSSIQTLDTSDKVAEIARMLGGIKLTDQTLAHAKEMLLDAT